MSASGINAAAGAAHAQAAQHSGQHRNRTHAPSVSDIDAQSSSVAASTKSTGRVGSRVDVRA
ncbi:MAG: hypothetical protein WAL80_16765 [Xanthobacteraceae bacterium]|jgi:hypothetical protein